MKQNAIRITVTKEALANIIGTMQYFIEKKEQNINSFGFLLNPAVKKEVFKKDYEQLKYLESVRDELTTIFIKNSVPEEIKELLKDYDNNK